MRERRTERENNSILILYFSMNYGVNSIYSDW